MTDTLSYIDDYFQQQLTEDEKHIFEKRCAEDTAFAGEVAFYITTRQVLKEELLQQKQASRKKEAKMNTAAETITVHKKSNFPAWLRYAAAACIILAVASYFFFSRESPQQFASNYITKNLTQLSQTMDAGGDSLQLGIAAYNRKDYGSALLIFEHISQSHPEKADAKKYAGYVCLLTGNYDKAVNQFQALADIKLPYSNPGLFLKAITLLKRNNPGDAAQAKGVLQQIVKEGLAEKQEAEDLLKKM